VGSRFSIKTAGLMGDTLVAVFPPDNPSGAVIGDGDRISGSPGSGLDQLPDTVNEISKETIAVLSDIREGLLNMNAALAKLDEQVLASENIENFNRTLSRMSRVVTKVDERFLSDANAENLNETLTSLKTTSQHLGEQLEKVGPLLDEAQASVKTIGPTVEEIGKAAAAAREVAETTNSLIQGIQEGDGLLNAIIDDEELKEQFTALIRNLKERGILFYKDKSKPKELGTETGTEPEEEEGTKKRGLFKLFQKP